MVYDPPEPKKREFPEASLVSLGLSVKCAWISLAPPGSVHCAIFHNPGPDEAGV